MLIEPIASDWAKAIGITAAVDKATQRPTARVRMEWFIFIICISRSLSLTGLEACGDTA
jgi:hypothetical protein